jgi:zinc carboxypeptidase
MTLSRPRTQAEASGFQRTSLHTEVMAFIEALKAAGNRRLHVEIAGTSPEGRDLPLLVLSSEGVATPEAAHALGRPVVLAVGGIHAGEVEGKEALLALARDLLHGPEGGILERLTLVVLPLYNPDGNDRIDPANRRLDLVRREGQDGPPTGVGTRVTSAGINLNRDYLRQDAPESRILSSRVFGRWAPHLTVDTHATNGSIHRYALTYDSPHTVESGPRAPIAYIRERFLPVVRERLRARTELETFFYGNFVQDEGGEGEGWMTYTHHPRFGSHYRGLTGRLDILAETYSYLSFPERVRTSYEFVTEVLRLAGERADEMIDLVARSGRPPDRIAVRYALEAFPDPVDILTYEPRMPDGRPVTVRIPHLADFRGTVVVDRPWAYAVPEAIARRLEGHGLRVARLESDREARVEAARIEGFAPIPSRKILEATSLGEKELLAEYRPAARRLPAGTGLVETDQPHGAVAVYLLEARSDDGALQCGWIPEPKPGEEFPIVRVVEPIR